ncbi:MAG: hypothetical protein HQ477_04695 [Chloroflexi bacterium]|nr:hypothetical protein [Chloroflexota bacterium]
MSRIKISSRQNHRLLVALIAVLVALLATACDDFYSDSLPTPDIAQPTPANVQIGDPQTLVEASARDAMAARLGIDPTSPKKILLQYETWTEQNPGCYPTPASITGAYLIPGYRLLMLQNGVFYEYNADEGAGTGALCESTFQVVPAEPAHSIVKPSDSATPDFDIVHILRSDEDVAEFNSTGSGMAVIGVDEIDFSAEVLVGGWVNSSPNPEVVRAYKSEEGTSIIIEIAVPKEFEEEISTAPSQIWVLVDSTSPDSAYEFIVVD